MTKPINIIIVFMLLAGLFLFIWYSCFEQETHADWKSTYCQVVRIVPGRSGGRNFVYFVDSNEYHGWTGQGLRGATTGDVYKILYNPESPKEYQWINEVPYFLKEEEKDITTGEITYISSPEENKFIYVEFKYELDGKSYRRLQCLPFVKEMKIQNGENYPVMYSPKTKQRSIIVPNTL
jgi:hypothetical protein